jgi:sirohydrochlorin ferrochelatase
MTDPLPKRIDIQGDWPSELAAVDIGIIIIDHGSRREESNQFVITVAADFQNSEGYRIVEPAHMELAQPDLAVAYDKCVSQGAKYIIVHPYFLAPGRHWHEDIPQLASAAAASHPQTSCVVTAPLGIHSAMLQIIADRIDQSW